MSDGKTVLLLFLENLLSQAEIINKHYISLSEKSDDLHEAIRYIALAAREAGKVDAFDQIIDLIKKA